MRSATSRCPYSARYAATGSRSSANTSSTRTRRWKSSARTRGTPPAASGGMREIGEVGESLVRVRGAGADPPRQRARFAEEAQHAEPHPELQQADAGVREVVDPKGDQPVERCEHAIRDADEVRPRQCAGIECAKLGHLSIEIANLRITQPVARVESARLTDHAHRRREGRRRRMRLRRHQLVDDALGLGQHPVKVQSQPRQLGHHAREDPAVSAQRPRRHVERVRPDRQQLGHDRAHHATKRIPRRGAGGSAVSGRACRIHRRSPAKAHSMSCGTPKCPSMERPAAASSTRCSGVSRTSAIAASARVPPPHPDGSPPRPTGTVRVTRSRESSTV